jgi:cell division initiation protein
MRITPLDIRKQEFKKTMRGLDSDEVYAFLNTVAEEYETVLSDNKRLRERIVELEERLKEFKSMETNLRNTLLTAERITAEAKDNARKEAGLIVREAEVEAEKAAESIRAHTQQLRREILELKKNKDNYITRMRTLLDSHQGVINGFEDDFAEVDNEIEKIGQKVEADTNNVVPGPRMTRDTITEDFGHEEKQEETDKVTWDDEQRREDMPMPSMPAPPNEAGASPEKKNSAPREEAAGAMNVPTAQHTEVEQSARQTEMEQIVSTEQMTSATQENVEPAQVPRDEISMANAEAKRVDFAAVNAEKIDVADEDDPGVDGHFNENAVRKNIARTIEDSMYPEAHIDAQQQAAVQDTPIGRVMESQPPSQPMMQQPPAMTSVTPDQAPAAQHEAGSTGTAVQDAPPQAQTMPENTPEQNAQIQDQPADEDQRRSDDWKSYEVNKAKPDWSNYYIVGSSQTQQPQQAPAPQPQIQQPAPVVHQSDASEVEVEAALSGLEEMGGSDQPEQQPDPPQQAQTSEQPVSGQVTQQPEEAETQAEAESGEEDSSSTWSMEELRKNLTNMDREE